MLSIPHKVTGKGSVKVCEGQSTFWLPGNQFPIELKCPLCFIDPYLSSRQPHSLVTPSVLVANIESSNGPLNEVEQLVAYTTIPVHACDGIGLPSFAISPRVHFACARYALPA